MRHNISFFSFHARLPRDDAGLGAEPVIFRRCIVLPESGMWPVSLILRVYYVSITKMWGLSQGLSTGAL